MTRREVVIGDGRASLHGELVVPEHPRGLVVCATSRAFAEPIGTRAEVATLHFDVGVLREEADDAALAQRLSAVTDWASLDAVTRHLPIGYVAEDAAAAAAILVASARRDVHVLTLIDGDVALAGPALDALRAPVLLLVREGNDTLVGKSRSARARLRGESELAVVDGDEEIVRRASGWLARRIS